VARIAFVINPIAGMGGRVGFKGTDGVAEDARRAGAQPVAPPRARAFLEAFQVRRAADASLSVEWLTASGPMGAEALAAAGFAKAEIEVVHEVHSPTTADDTIRVVANAVGAGAQLILFCGGDGTARDVATAASNAVPLLGIPAGVKMHSGIFAATPSAAAELLAAYLRGELRTAEAEILDLDEDAYRKGVWKVRLYASAQGLSEANLVPAGKAMFAEVSDAEILTELADHVSELFEEERDAVFILGPGSTMNAIATRLGLEKTLLGIDAVLDRKTIETDLNEARLLALLAGDRKARLLVSPIGVQGFILGRGNLQLSPAVLRRIGVHNLIVISTPSKLDATPVLRVDTGDADLDEELVKKEYLFVIVGYRTSRLHPIRG